MKAAAQLVLLMGLVAPLGVDKAVAAEFELPSVVLRDVPFDVTVKDTGLEEGAGVVLRTGGKEFPGTVSGGSVTFSDVQVASDPAEFTLVGPGDAAVASETGDTLAGWLSVVPAVLAIVLALALRQVIPALFLGIWVGGALVHGSVAGLWYGFLDTISKYTLDALNDWGHIAVILFSLMIGGMVGIISKNGGTRGIVNLIIRRANTPKRGQLSTAGLGVAIFFDDYANTLIVGNTMRSITDKLRVSREKLAYIVDSTAAPVATLLFVTTWIGFQVGLIDDAVRGIEGYGESAYSIFLNSIAYNFYPILAILFVFFVVGTGRDFGPMLKAERRARSTGQVSRPGAHMGESPEDEAEREPKPDKPQRAINAIVPVLVLVIGSLAGIYITGAQSAGPDASLREIIGSGDSFLGLMWASLLAVAVAGVMSVAQGILTLTETIDSWYAGVRSMLLAIIILLMAWALSAVNGTLGTGDYLVSALGGTLSPFLVPALVFVLSAATAFATGTSWGVMGIMMPLVVPLAWKVMELNGLTAGDEYLHVLYASVSAVLAGAVWGDHCSPISDTTILSSLASKCDHIDHVRTQIPYAVTVGAVGLIALTVASYGAPWWLVLVVAAAILFVGLRYFGQPTEDASEVAATAKTGHRSS